MTGSPVVVISFELVDSLLEGALGPRTDPKIQSSSLFCLDWKLEYLEKVAYWLALVSGSEALSGSDSPGFPTTFSQRIRLSISSVRQPDFLAFLINLCLSNSFAVGLLYGQNVILCEST